jgi:uncharacterized protein YjbI with pentapeptide repeats
MRWVVVSILGLLFLLGSATSAAARPKVIRASTIAARVRRGEPVLLDQVTVRGDLDLTAADVTGAFSCSECVFTRSIIATDAVFHQTFELFRCDIGGSLLFHGARFDGPVKVGGSASLLGVTTDVAVTTDFSLASFATTANFSSFRGEGPADFTQASFHGESVFDSTVFADGPAFEAAEFARVARFADTRLPDDPDFEDASMQDGADFRRATMAGGSFINTDFFGPADFSDAAFPYSVDFNGVRFRRGANFTRAKFIKSDDPLFAGAESGETLNFSRAVFGDDVDFTDLDATDTLSFDRAKIAGTLKAANLTAHDLRMSLEQVKHAPRPDQASLLRQIETSAKARGDYGAANNAYYELQIVNSDGYRWPARVLDLVFYRGVAGYLVRPEHPLVILALLALTTAIFTLLRKRTLSSSDRVGHRMKSGAAAVSTVATETFRRLGAAVPTRFGGNGQPLPRLEQIAYRVLLVCVLIGIWANPALRELVNLFR